MDQPVLVDPEVPALQQDLGFLADHSGLLHLVLLESPALQDLQEFRVVQPLQVDPEDLVVLKYK